MFRAAALFPISVPFVYVTFSVLDIFPAWMFRFCLAVCLPVFESCYHMVYFSCGGVSPECLQLAAVFECPELVFDINVAHLYFMYVFYFNSYSYLILVYVRAPWVL
jgi:hypothetical protein